MSNLDLQEGTEESRMQEMHTPITTLVCFAVKEESRAFERLASQRPGVRVLITGMGAQNAERSVKAALASGQPGRVLSCGFAGGLRSDLATGAVVFSAAVETGLGPRLLSAGARQISFHFANRVAATAEEKRRLRESTGADAVEMESRVICDLCTRQNISSATVRVILDTVGEDLPLDFNELLTADQRINTLKLARALLQSPGKIPALLRLQKQSDFAAKRLAEVLGSILADELS